MNRARLAASRWWIAAALALAGLLVGLLVALVSPHDHRAESVVRFSGPGVDALLPDLRALATSSVLAGNVTSTLRLPDSPDSVQQRLSATVRRGTRLIAIRVRASTTDKARQLAQEAAVVLTQIAPRRFSSVQAQVFDPGHGIGGGNRHWFRDLGLGLLGGLCLGLFAAAALAGGGGAVSIPFDGADLLARRTELVGRREAAVAKRVGELAVRERELEARARALDERQQNPTPAPEPTPAPAPERPAEMSAPSTPAHAPDGVALNLRDLEQYVAARSGDADEVQREQWNAYLFFLREHAAADGSLPGQFAELVEEVFRPIRPSRRS